MNKKKQWFLRFGVLIWLSVLGLFFSGCGSALKYGASGPVFEPVKKSEPETEQEPEPEKEYSSLDYYSGGSGKIKPYKVFGKWYRPLAHARGFKQQGIASWYGEEFHGKPTSNGEIYDMHAVSAAHKILPMNTYVRVKNLKNGKTLDMRINDRGPFVSGRIIDLSYGAAKKLGVIGPGTAPVEVIALGTAYLKKTPGGNVMAYKPGDYDQGNFSIQIGAFGERKNAEKLMQEMISAYKHAYIKPGTGRSDKKKFYRVLVGKCTSLEQAEQYENLLKTKGFKDAFTIAD